MEKVIKINQNTHELTLIILGWKRFWGVIGAVMVVLGLWTNLAMAAEVVTDNLIKNHSAASGTTSWVPSNGFTTQCDSFRGGGQNGGGVLSDAYQDVDVSQYAGAINGDSAKMDFSGWVKGQGGQFSHDDNGWFEITFYDGSGNNLGIHSTGWHHGDWTKFEIKDKLLPKETRKIRVKMGAHRDCGENQVDVWFDDLQLKLKAPKMEVMEKPGFNLDSVYVVKNESASAYNKSKKETLSFKNTGVSYNTTQDWSISSSPYNWIKFSGTSGTLEGGGTKNVDVWVEPPEGYPDKDYRDYSGNFTLTLPFDTIKISVSVRAYKPIGKPKLKSPALGTNSKVNVATSESVQFEVIPPTNSTFPEATRKGYQWKLPGNFDFGNIGNTITDPKKTTSFSDASEYTVYCRAIDDNSVTSDILEIPVRAWNRPIVKNTPPQSVSSWYNNKYVGVVGRLVYLMADA